jgi:hypothetical protein
VFKEPERYYWFCSCEPTSLRISKNEETEEPKEERHKYVPRSPAVTRASVRQGIQDRNSGGY